MEVLEQEYIGLDLASQRLGVSEGHLRKLIRQGQLSRATRLESGRYMDMVRTESVRAYAKNRHKRKGGMHGISEFNHPSGTG